jgi:hypothetical protein
MTAPFNPAYGDVVEAPVVSPDFTVAEFLAWVRTKPADERYEYCDPGNCALCGFLRETGRAKEPRVSPYLSDWDPTAGWRENGEDYSARRPYPIILESELSACDDTFGALAARLEAIV